MCHSVLIVSERVDVVVIHILFLRITTNLPTQGLLFSIGLCLKQRLRLIVSLCTYY